MDKKIELLSPAGSYEAFTAAINAGCDAVYLGGKSFSARANANNFTDEALKRAIDIAHLNNKKVYLTANTLVKNREFEAFYEQINLVYKEGIDAVIIQDIGAYQFMQQYFKDLPLHGSTQMTVHNHYGAKFLKDLGFERVVPARECSIDELRKIKKNVDIELEIFIHGALCYCYSGQCLLSSVIGGRSGNRGQCAQPCRLGYEVLMNHKKVNGVNEQFILSPKDTMSLNILPEILDLGVHSLKIEGRMKSPEYVGLITSIYRRYIDLYYSNEKRYKVSDKDLSEMLQIYNRGGFTDGYLKGQVNKKMISLNKPNHYGIKIGQVTSVRGNTGKIKVQLPVRQDDYLEVINSKGEPLQVFLQEDTKDQGVIYIKKGKLKGNAKVYRLVDKSLNERLNREFVANNNKRLINCKLIGKLNEPLTLKLYDEVYETTVYGDEVTEAKNAPITEEKIIKQLNKTGNEVFDFEQIEVAIDDHIFLPVSGINQLRRKGIESLFNENIRKYKRDCNDDIIKLMKDKHQDKNNHIVAIKYSVLIRDYQQFKYVKNYPINQLYVEFTRFSIKELKEIIDEGVRHGIDIYMALPVIIDENNVEKMIDKLSKVNHFEGFLVRSYDQLLLTKTFDKKVHLDYSVHSFNDFANDFWVNYGIDQLTVSSELNKKELQRMNVSNAQMMIYGYLRTMVSKQCVYKNITGKCHTKDQPLIQLRDRQGVEFTMQKDCEVCLNTLYNSRPTVLIDKIEELKGVGLSHFRIEFLNESKEEIESIMNYLFNNENERSNLSQILNKEFTRGHYTRGVK